MGKYQYFEPSEELNLAINQGNMKLVRGLLSGIINRDPTFATKRFIEARDYIENERGKILLEDYLELEGEYDQQNWDEKYYGMCIVWLSDNFSKKRLEKVKQVGEKVFANKMTWGKQQKIENSKQNHATEIKKVEGNQGERKTSGKVVMICGLIALVVLACLIVKIIVKTK